MSLSCSDPGARDVHPTSPRTAHGRAQTPKVVAVSSGARPDLLPRHLGTNLGNKAPRNRVQIDGMGRNQSDTRPRLTCAFEIRRTWEMPWCVAHWTTFWRSSLLDGALMHPGCHQVTALLA